MLLADLPTNGLDSASAYALMRNLRFACRGGYSCMAVLVQPSAEITNLLHKVMLLCKGAVIYYGALSYAEDYLRDAGFVRPSQKPLPQFMEELSSKPESFYHTSLIRAVSFQAEAATALQPTHRHNDTDKDDDSDSVTVNVGGGVPEGMGEGVEAGLKEGKRYAAWSILVSAYHSSPMYIPLASEVEKIGRVGAKNRDAEANSSSSGEGEGREEYELHEAKQHSKYMGWWYKQVSRAEQRQRACCY
jgi:hypothetical protein